MPIPTKSPIDQAEAVAADQHTAVQPREIAHSELPLFCPREDTTLWSQHPRVYLPIEKGGDALCPYCGTRFILKDSS